MKRFNYLVIFLLAMVMTLSSCELVGDIFQAGMAVGIIVIIAVVGLVIWLISRFRRK
jgi:heme/copper-type cytochrome/quinol oxidase subunit 4